MARNEDTTDADDGSRGAPAADQAEGPRDGDPDTTGDRAPAADQAEGEGGPDDYADQRAPYRRAPAEAPTEHDGHPS